MSKELTEKKWMTQKPTVRKQRIAIYDFDGTLFRSPTREEGEVLYRKSTGKELPFPGWWGRLESLSPPIVPEIPEQNWWFLETVSALRKDSEDENTEIILMTGRPFKNRKRVLAICQTQNLEFDSQYFRGQPGQKGRDTFEIKSNFIINDIIHSNLKVLEVWDDRPEHISAFFTLLKKLKNDYQHLERIIIHDVFSNLKHEI